MKRTTVLLVLAAVPPLVACGKVVLEATGGPDPMVVVTPNPLTNSLVAHYRLDEDGGTIVHDTSGNKRDGILTLGGGMWLLEGGVLGGALHFSGNDFMTVDNFPNATPDFTVSAWVRLAVPPNGFGTLLSTETLYDGGWQFNLEPWDSGIAAHFAYWDSREGGVQGDPQPPLTILRCSCIVPNQWMHLVSVVDNTAHTLSLYVDGTLAGPPRQGVPAILPGAPSLYVGTWSGPNGGRFLVGDVDDVTIYGRVLQPSEVLALESSPPPDVP